MELTRRSHGGRPRAKVLDRVVCGRERAQVRIQIVRSNPVGDALLVDVLKQLFASKRSTVRDQSREPSIAEDYVPEYTAFSAILELYDMAANPGMVDSKRSQPEAIVGARVLFVADTNRRQVDDPKHCGEDGLTP
jgi:hypothetical protein